MKATADARANIAFVKYWGRADHQLNVPLNDSISLTLDKLRTVTTVSFEADLKEDVLELNGATADAPATRRASAHLDHLRKLRGVEDAAHVVSANAFATAGGLASSASGFAALTVAGAAALGLDLDARDLSRIARLGSGSACRSIYGGYVRWRAGRDHETSYAEPVHPPEHWALRDVVVTVEKGPKKVGSLGGHQVAESSPLLPNRLQWVETALSGVTQALKEHDLKHLGRTIETEALNMHAIMMTSDPSLVYWTPETVRFLHLVRDWRDDGVPVYMTLDAGPNPHLITDAAHADDVVGRVAEAGYEGDHVLVAGPGEGPKVL